MCRNLYLYCNLIRITNTRTIVLLHSKAHSNCCIVLLWWCMCVLLYVGCWPPQWWLFRWPAGVKQITYVNTRFTIWIWLYSKKNDLRFLYLILFLIFHNIELNLTHCCDCFRFVICFLTYFAIKSIICIFCLDFFIYDLEIWIALICIISWR